MFSKLLLVILGACVVLGQEPICSHVSYLDHLLEKLVRMEIRMDNMQTQLDEFMHGHTQRGISSHPIQVAFSAAAEVKRSTYDADEIVMFDKEITNIGAAFDVHTGIFTAPVNGTYFFRVSILADNDAEIWAYVVVNDMKTVYMNARASDGRHDTGSQSLIISLKKGDAVKVHNYSSGARYYGEFYTTFAGFLLF